MNKNPLSAEARLEAQLRQSLRQAAQSPAPASLLNRVAAIPLTAHRPSPWSFLMRLSANLAAVAVLVLAFGALIVLRPSPAPPGLPSASGGLTGSPSASASSSASPSASSSPTPAISGLTAVPAPSPSPTNAAPAGGPVPVGLQVFSVTFASPTLGWALGTAPCTAPPCTSIVRTSDGGRSWVGLPAPRTPLLTAGASESAPGVGVSGLRFANANDGWAYGPDLWATHDGGAHWQRLALPGSAGATVVGLEAAGGVAQLALFDGGTVRLAASPVGRDQWQLSAVSVPIGAGPVPAASLVLAGSSGWLLEVDRTVVGGARLAGANWSSWNPPCAASNGPAILAAVSADALVAACDLGLWSTPQGEHLYFSADGGTSFTTGGTKSPLSAVGAIAAPAPDIIFLAGTGPNGTTLVRSLDRGQSWHTVLETGVATISYLGFTTPSQGVLLSAAPGGSGSTDGGSLWITRDGGATWVPVKFGA